MSDSTVPSPPHPAAPLVPRVHQVLIVITRWRTEANEERERQGLSRVYLLEHKAAEAEARAAQAATAGTAGLTATELKRMRAAE